MIKIDDKDIVQVTDAVGLWVIVKAFILMMMMGY